MKMKRFEERMHEEIEKACSMDMDDFVVNIDDFPSSIIEIPERIEPN